MPDPVRPPRTSTPAAAPGSPAAQGFVRRRGGARRGRVGGPPVVRLGRGRGPSRGAVLGPTRAPSAGGGGAARPSRPVQVKVAQAAKDPRFQQALRRLDRSADRAGSHPPAAKKAAEAQAAALPPANEKLAGAKAGNVEAMQAAETGKPENTSFLAMLRAEIQKVMPKKTEDAGEFMQGDDKGRLKGAMTGNISQQKEQATGAVHAASTTPPDPSRVPGKEVTALPDDRPPAPTPIDAGSAMPAPQPPAAVSLEQGKQDADKAVKDAELTTPQLQKANDPRFSAVLTAKADVDKKANSLPQQFRTREQRTIGEAVAKAQGDERKGVNALAGQQRQSGAAVRTRQLTAKQKDEQERKKVADMIEQYYAGTKLAVDKKLEGLDKEVEQVFDAGTEAAIQKMKDYVETRFDDRYSGISGKVLWLKDKIRPLPAAVKVWFDEAHKVFLAEMDALVVRVANLVETRLREAKDEIRKGEQRIADYVKGLPANLQSVGRAAQQEMSGRFEELRRGVDDKKSDLAEKLAQRYKDAYEKGATALQDLKDAHKSLVEKLKEFVEKVVKILREFKDRIVSMLKKNKDTISLIIADPIGFLGNLLSAIKQGISQFVDRFEVHLREGFMEWLFGSLAEAGIVLPKDFSLPSILRLVLAVLGVTYEKIRAKAVKQIGERNVGLIEQAAALIKELVTGGLARLWEMAKEYLGNLQEMLTTEILLWLVGQIVKAAVTKLISMFNPVGAIIQAILMIYRTVMFFIERINQILDFVEAIINSVSKIAAGDIGGAADWIEQSLARAIPLMIAFLARLLGISGITDKIKRIIHKLQTKVDLAIDKVVEKVVGGVRRVGQSAVQAGRRVISALVDWLTIRTGFQTSDGTPHTLLTEVQQGTPTVIIQSRRRTFADYLRDLTFPASDRAKNQAKGRASTIFGRIVTKLTRLKTREASFGDNPTATQRGELRTMGDDIRGEYILLSEQVKIMGIGGARSETVLTRIHPTSGSKLNSLEAKPLTALRGNTVGDPNANRVRGVPGWSFLDQIDNSRGNDGTIYNEWVRWHLIHSGMHGPASVFNLVTAPRSQNTRFAGQVEAPVLRRLLEPGTILYYKVTITYGNSVVPLNDFPTSISYTWGTMKEGSGGNYVEDQQLGSQTYSGFPVPALRIGGGPVTITLKALGEPALHTRATLPPRVARRIALAVAAHPSMGVLEAMDSFYPAGQDQGRPIAQFLVADKDAIAAAQRRLAGTAILDLR